MIPKRANRTALIACAVLGVSVLPATAWATTSATAASANPSLSHRATVSGKSCEFYTAIYGDTYVEPVSATSLDWAVPRRTSGTAIRLENVSARSLLDCFHVEGNFGHSRLEFELANSSLCLNIARASKNDGAWAVLYPCNSQLNELFYLYPDDGGVQLQNANSGLCLDLTAGDSRGSIVDQEPCGNGNLLQAWAFAGGGTVG